MANLRVKLGLALWGVGWLATSLISLFSHRSVTPAYRGAAAAWLQQQDMYLGSGFFYFPQFVFLFLPFHALPVAAGEMAWRLVSVSLLVWGLWRMLALSFSPVERGRAFLIATLLVLVPALDAMRNGQANVIFAALTLLAASRLSGSEDKKTAASASYFLIGSLAAKPIGIVMIGLAGLSSARMRWRLAGLMLLFLALPFLGSPLDNVTGQYESMFRQLAASSVSKENHFADFNGLLRVFDAELKGTASLLMRAGAGLAVAGVWLWAARRNRAGDRGFILLGLTVSYLLLFNPMTEQNSVVIAAPWMALFALRLLILEHRPVAARTLAGLLLSMTLLPELLRKLSPDLGLWWHPTVMLIFLAVFLSWIFSSSTQKV